MNIMKIPGFTAEASLYQISGQYHPANQLEHVSGTVHPAFGHLTPSLRDRSRVVPRSDSACVFTKRFLRSENAGFTKSRRVIGMM